MTGAAKGKSLPASLAAARVLLLLAVTLLLGQTRVWGFAAPPQPAPGQISLASPSSVGENYDGDRYDVPDSLLAAKAPLTPNPYAGVQEASAHLRDQGVPRDVRRKVLESFDVRTIGVRQAGASEYGIRYFDNVDALAKGRYLFETFPASRASLALDPQWNKMTNFTQWQIRPGAIRRGAQWGMRSV